MGLEAEAAETQFWLTIFMSIVVRFLWGQCWSLYWWWRVNESALFALIWLKQQDLGQEIVSTKYITLEAR